MKILLPIIFIAAGIAAGFFICLIMVSISTLTGTLYFDVEDNSMYLELNDKYKDDVKKLSYAAFKIKKVRAREKNTYSNG